jgi:hypothetical protein
MRRLWPMVILAIACKPPPDAPGELEELCEYLFLHMADEETEELEAGLFNLDAWLTADMESTAEGYTINKLSQEAIATTGKSSENTDNMVGAAVATESVYGITRLTEALVTDDQAELWADNYNVFDRNYDSDASCFPDRECETLTGTTYGEATWAGLIDVVSQSSVEFRWVETELGWMMMQRSWLDEPAEVSWESVEVNGQYFLAILLPADSGTIRMQSTWIDTDYGSLPVSEDFALNQVVKSMQATSETLEEWIAEN